MKIPSPIPHPLFWWSSAPGVVLEAVEFVVGVEWPAGNEKLTWDLADQWLGGGEATKPGVESIARGGPAVVAGWGGLETDQGDLVDQIWRHYAENPEGGLLFLGQILQEIGEMVDQTACDIESAKIEMYIELLFMIGELLFLIASAFLTVGASMAAGPAVIAAGRWAITRVFKELLKRMLSRALKSVTKDAIKASVKKFSKENLRKFGKMAVKHAVREGAEEAGSEFAIQQSQIARGRREQGIDVVQLGLATAGGAVGGALGGVASLGPNAKTGLGRTFEAMGRGALGEGIAETGASLATGQGFTSGDNFLRSLTSGARSGLTGHGEETLNGIRSDINDHLTQLAGDQAPGSGGSFDPTGTGPNNDAVQPIDVTSPHSTNTGAPGSGSTVAGGATTYTGSTYTGSTFADPDVGSDGTGAHGGSAGTVHSGVSDGTQPGQHGLTVPGLGSGTVDLAGVASPNATLGNPALSNPALGNPALGNPALGNPTVQSLDLGQQHATNPTGVAALGQPGLTTATAPTAFGPTVAPPGAAPAIPGQVGTPGSTSPGVSSTPGGLATHPPASASAVTTSSPTATAPTTRPPMDQRPPASTMPTSSTPPRPRNDLTGPAQDPTIVPVVSPIGAPGPGSRPMGDPTGHDSRGPTDRSGPALDTDPAVELARREVFSRAGEYEAHRQRDLANSLTAQADHLHGTRRVTRDQLQEAEDAGDLALADRFSDEDARLSQSIADLDDAALGARRPTGEIRIDDEAHRHINQDTLETVSGGLDTDRLSALGDRGSRPVEDTRAYDRRGGHRRPFRWDQALLERLVPTDGSGRPVRFASVFGDWLTKLNDSGPDADPTRGINCVDCVLSFVDTWFHGRPRVSAPRTLDSYLDGDVTNPLHGQTGGLRRISDALGVDFVTSFRAIDPDHPGLEESYFQDRVRGLEQTLIDAGPGSFLVLAHQCPDGRSHTWLAVNQDGQVVYVDPQLSTADLRPPYNAQSPYRGISRLDAAGLDAHGRPLRIDPDSHQLPWVGADPTGARSAPGGAFGNDPRGQRRDARPQPPAPEPGSLRERLLVPHDPVASPPTPEQAHPTPQPWDAWKDGDGARMRADAVAEVARRYGLSDQLSVQGLAEAYTQIRDHVAPFVVQVATAMLADFRADVAANPDHKIVFVGRDGIALGLAIQGLDPEFYARSCTEISMSRRSGMLAILDRERLAKSPILADGYRWTFDARDRYEGDIAGSAARLRQHLERQGVPVGPGGSMTIVDSSFKGTGQEMLSALYPKASFKGAYIWHGQSPDDPHPGTKKGYATQLPEPALRTGEIPDPGWETNTYEYLVRGPMSSPIRYAAEGTPVQVPESSSWDTTYGRVPENQVTPGFRNDRSAPGRERLRDAVLEINRRAIADYARHIATVADPAAELLAGFDAYRRLTYNWDQQPTPAPVGVPERLRRFWDSFTPGTRDGRQRWRPVA